MGNSSDREEDLKILHLLNDPLYLMFGVSCPLRKQFRASHQPSIKQHFVLSTWGDTSCFHFPNALPHFTLTHHL